MTVLHSLLRALLTTLPATAEEGFSTAELLANAALGVAALVVLWGLFGTLGGEVIDFIRSAIGV